MNIKCPVLSQIKRVGLLILLVLAGMYAVPAVAHAQGPIVFDFEEDENGPLARGQVITSLTKDGLTMSIVVESDGPHDAAMIFDSNQPGTNSDGDPDLGSPNQSCPGGGPGVGAGGVPGGLGPNCLPLDNVLIIPESVPPATNPDDENAGGTITLTFSQPVQANLLELLDIEEDGLLIQFFRPDGSVISESEISQPNGLGNNSYEEFLLDVENVQSIELFFPGSGALDAVIVTPMGVGTASVGDYVWVDTNYDGIQNDGAASGVNGATVKLFESDNNLVATTATADHPVSGIPGFYMFSDVEPGTYYIQFELPDGFAFTKQIAPDALPNATHVDSNANPTTGKTGNLTLMSGDYNPTIDAGLIATPLGSIGDTVWYDKDGDGVQGVEEPGIPGVTVTLTKAQGATQQTTTDDTGFYLFNSLMEGTYTVAVDTNSGGLAGGGYTQTGDPDAVLDSQSTVVLASGENNLEQDFGYQPTSPTVPGSIGDTVWLDANADGQQGSGEAGIANVEIVLTGRDGLTRTTTTDDDGFYLFTDLPPDVYTVRVVGSTLPSGLVQTYDLDGILNNETTLVLDMGDDRRDVDFGYVPAPAELGTIGDTVWYDLNENGVQDDGEPGIGNVTLILTAARGTVGTTQTNSEGWYTFAALPSGLYTVSVDTATLPPGATQVYDIDGVLDNQSSLTLDTGETNLEQDFGYLPPALGSIGDTLWCDVNRNSVQDNSEEGLPQVTVTLLDETGAPIDQVDTDINGIYVFTDLPPGTYTVVVDAQDLPQSCDIPRTDLDGTPDNQTTVTLTQGEVQRDVDFGYEPLEPGTIGDTIWCDDNGDGLLNNGEAGLPQVTVTLLDSSGTPIDSVQTNPNGIYLFEDLPPGTYTVVIDTSTLPTRCNLPVSESDGTLDNQIGVELESGGSNLDVDFGYQPAEPVRIGDTLWCDVNANGSQESGESGLPQVTVTVLDENDTPVASVQTDANGLYLFDDLPAGTYTVVVDTSTIPTSCDMPNSELDNTLNGRVEVTLDAGEENLDVDFGYRPAADQPATLGDRVWRDNNGNGIQDEGETGIANVEVTLLDGDGNVVAVTTTDDNGLYLFEDVPPGDYIVSVSQPEDFAYAPVNQGDDDAVDSDIEPETGQSAVVTLLPGQVNTTVDVGLYRPLPLLAITKVAEGMGVAPGGTLTYTLVYSNAGTADATGVVVREVVPEFTTFDATTSTPGWTCENGNTGAGTVCLFEVGLLPVGARGSITFGVIVDTDLPDTAVQIVNQVVINGDSTAPGQGSTPVVTPIQVPTGLDDSDEEPVQSFIYVPLVERPE